MNYTVGLLSLPLITILYGSKFSSTTATIYAFGVTLMRLMLRCDERLLYVYYQVAMFKL